MPRRKLPYKEGDWFAVPLRTQGYGVGRVARMSGRGLVIGYFFGPKHNQLPTVEDVIDLTPDDAILIRRLGDLGLLEGEWPIIYRPEPEVWLRNDWPLPAFGSIAVDQSRAWRTEYSEEDINKVIREAQVDVEQARHLPDDALAGYGALEIVLTKLLN